MVAIACRQTYKVRGKSSPTSAARAADSPHRYQWLSLLRAPKAASHSLPPRSSTSSRQPEKAPVFPVLSMQVEAGHTAASNPVCSSCILRSANMARDSGRRNGARLDVAAGAAGDRVRPALSGRVRVVVALPETRSWVKRLGRIGVADRVDRIAVWQGRRDWRSYKYLCSAGRHGCLVTRRTSRRS